MQELGLTQNMDQGENLRISPSFNNELEDKYMQMERRIEQQQEYIRSLEERKKIIMNDDNGFEDKPADGQPSDVQQPDYINSMSGVNLRSQNNEKPDHDLEELKSTKIVLVDTKLDFRLLGLSF